MDDSDAYLCLELLHTFVDVVLIPSGLDVFEFEYQIQDLNGLVFTLHD